MAGTKREKELAKQRAERQAARAAAAAARRKGRNQVIATVVAVLLLTTGLGVMAATLSGGGSPTEDVAQATPSAEASAKPGECRYEDTGNPSKQVKKPPTTDVETEGVYVATMTTNVGTITWNMDAGITPCTVNSMRALAHQEYFDGTSCHRLTSQGIFVLQCGDPSGDGTGGPGYRFADENLEGATYPAGTVAMANSGPGTNGSQFFLVYKASQLPPDYTPFGRISKGLDVLAEVAAGGSTPPGDGEPKTAVEVKTLRTTKKA